MPALSTAIIVGGIVGAAGSIASAKMNSNAARRAAQAQERAASEAMAAEREAESENRRQFDITQETNQRNWETEQDREQMRYDQGRTDSLRREAQDAARWAYDNRRRSTSRAAGRAAVEALARDAGLTLRDVEPPPDYSQGWSPEDMTPPKESETFRRPGATAPPNYTMPVVNPNDPKLTRRPMADLGTY